MGGVPRRQAATHLGGDGAAELADEGELVLLRVALHDGAAGHISAMMHPAPHRSMGRGRSPAPLGTRARREGPLSPHGLLKATPLGPDGSSPGSWGAETELSAQPLLPSASSGRVLTVATALGAGTRGSPRGWCSGWAGCSWPRLKARANPRSASFRTPSRVMGISRLHVPVQDLQEAQGGGFPGIHSHAHPL